MKKHIKEYGVFYLITLSIAIIPYAVMAVIATWYKNLFSESFGLWIAMVVYYPICSLLYGVLSAKMTDKVKKANTLYYIFSFVLVFSITTFFKFYGTPNYAEYGLLEYYKAYLGSYSVWAYITLLGSGIAFEIVMLCKDFVLGLKNQIKKRQS